MPRDNPFYYNLPTQPADFVGRWPLVEEIVADLSKGRADSWAVIGGRRFGKSSVLKAIEWRLMERLADCGQGERHVLPLVVDLKGSETDTEQNVYARIGRLLHRALRRDRVLAVDLAQTDLDTVRRAETLSFYQFEDTLDNLADHFERHCGPLRLALLLDEVEVTTRFAWSETLFNQLRALIYDGPLADVVKLVLTGAARVIHARHAGSPLWNALRITHMESFSAADLQKLIARGGKIPDEATAAVRMQSGGHPFIAQLLLHHLWDNGLVQATSMQVEQIARRMRQRRAADLQGWWEAVGDSGRHAYMLLARADDWVDERELLMQARDIKQPLDQGLAALCYHGLAVRDESGQRYRIVGALFREWFFQKVMQNVLNNRKITARLVSPFVVTGPASKDVFFGRGSEIREITELVPTSSFAIIGGRRIGKSSLLVRLHCDHLLTLGFCTIYHDCSTTPTYDAFLAAAIRDWRSGPLLDAPTTFGGLLQSPPDDKPLVLLLDEADKLVPMDRASNWQLFNVLRGLVNSGHTQVVLSGERILRNALRDPTSPLFNFANEVLLGPLDFRAVEELVTRPMKQLEIELVDEKAIVDRIWAFTSGHPNVVQRLCRRLIERLNEQGARRITLDDVNAVIEDPGFQRDDFLNTYWENATLLERILSLLLAQADQQPHALRDTRRLLDERLGLVGPDGEKPSSIEVDTALGRLVDLRSILERTPRGYTFAVSAFVRVVTQPDTVTIDDLFEMYSEAYSKYGDLTLEEVAAKEQRR